MNFNAHLSPLLCPNRSRIRTNLLGHNLCARFNDSKGKPFLSQTSKYKTLTDCEIPILLHSSFLPTPNLRHRFWASKKAKKKMEIRILTHILTKIFDIIFLFR